MASPLIDGHLWYPSGQSAYTGAALALQRRLDRMFVAWGHDAFRATEYVFPPFVAASELAKLDYFSSFQHLATFPVALDPDEANLQRFAEATPVGEDGVVHLTACTPPRDVLTPAACYHFYIQLQGTQLDGPRYLTTKAFCFRREKHYAPLERQSAFEMRELVCIGGEADVVRFLGQMRETVEKFVTAIDLPLRWDKATDPFFRPMQNPKYVAQRLTPLKTEMVFDSHLAIGSVNLHRSYFGEAFGITTPDGEAAYSGCVAFGLDRWVFAFAKRFGPNEAAWPVPP